MSEHKIIKVPGGTRHLVLVLFLIAFITSLSLSMVNAITKDRIHEINQKMILEAMRDVVGGAQLSDIETQTGSDRVLAYAKTEDGSVSMQVGVMGFDGPITMIVGVDANHVVSGVRITSMSETPGLGAKAGEEEWLAQFVGSSAGVTVTKQLPGENQVQAITSATTTSDAVVDGVRSAVDFANKIR